MSDLYQGKIGTVSPAFGAYDINIFINIDRDMGVTGPVAAGVTGTGTLEPCSYEMGLTGISSINRTDESLYF
jgi:hypothetical protein